MSACGAFVSRGMALGVRGAAEQPATASSASAAATYGAWLTAPPSGMLAQLEAPDLAPMHLVRPVREAQRPRVRPHERQRKLLAHAAPAVDLHRPVDDLADAGPRRGRREPGVSAGVHVGALADAALRGRAGRGASAPDRAPRAAQAFLRAGR